MLDALCMLDAHQRFKILTKFSEISFLSFIFRYIFRITITSNKVFCFSQVNVFIACHLSKIYHQVRKKSEVLFDLKHSNFCFKATRFSIQKKDVFLEIKWLSVRL